MVTGADGRELGFSVAGSFDAVLVDVPCSCEGNVRKDSVALLKAVDKAELLVRQQELLRSGWEAVRPGGWLVYSTCTFDVEENEEQVERFLRAVEAVEVDVGSYLEGVVSGSHGAQLWPQSMDVEGFFVCRGTGWLALFRA